MGKPWSRLGVETQALKRKQEKFLPEPGVRPEQQNIEKFLLEPGRGCLTREHGGSWKKETCERLGRFGFQARTATASA